MPYLGPAHAAGTRPPSPPERKRRAQPRRAEAGHTVLCTLYSVLCGLYSVLCTLEDEEEEDEEEEEEEEDEEEEEEEEGEEEEEEEEEERHYAVPSGSSILIRGSGDPVIR